MSDAPHQQPSEQAKETRRSRGYLPHWERASATYFVTFRLADALPQVVLARYEAEREALLARMKAHGRVLSSEEQQRLARFFSERIQRFLDTGVGACALRQPAVAELVAGALRHFQGTRYHLFAWCIMPNHVHAVVQPLGAYPLARILHSWKSFTSHEANRLLGVKGALWEREYYDHFIRDERDFQHALEYVVSNPLKANLPDWPWVEVNVPL